MKDCGTKIGPVDFLLVSPKVASLLEVQRERRVDRFEDRGRILDLQSPDPIDVEALKRSVFINIHANS